jgi:hypothetical protein
MLLKLGGLCEDFESIHWTIFTANRSRHAIPNYGVQKYLISHCPVGPIAADNPPAPISKVMPCIVVPFSFEVFKSTMHRCRECFRRLLPR